MIIQKGTTTIIIPQRIDNWFLIPRDFRSLFILPNYITHLKVMLLDCPYVKARCYFISKELRQHLQAEGTWYEILDGLEKVSI